MFVFLFFTSFPLYDRICISPPHQNRLNSIPFLWLIFCSLEVHQHEWIKDLWYRHTTEY